MNKMLNEKLLIEGCLMPDFFSTAGKDHQLSELLNNRGATGYEASPHQTSQTSDISKSDI